MAIDKFKVVYHYDVWGNEEDGWEVNDSRPGPTIEVEREPSEGYRQRVWDALVEAGEAQGKFEEAEFFESGSGYEIHEAATCKPVWSLYTEDW
jgi:hypothetical protein